jgi:hypothetical protein
VSAGKVRVLFTLITPQADVMLDQTAELRIVRALAAGQADLVSAPVTLKGKLKGGRFTSDPPAAGSVLLTWELEVPLGPGLAPASPRGWQFNGLASGSRSTRTALACWAAVSTDRFRVQPSTMN